MARRIAPHLAYDEEKCRHASPAATRVSPTREEELSRAQGVLGREAGDPASGAPPALRTPALREASVSALGVAPRGRAPSTCEAQ